jgi:predicted adenylyl cyclase CyaB
MKLRYLGRASGQLIFYKREDKPKPRASEYHIYDTANPERLEQVLSGAHGVLASVKKIREVHLIDNVRVHLDDVEGLGQFIEFEAVLSDEKSAEKEKQKLEKYIDQFKIDRSKLLAISYLDMALARGKAK